jgi:hypothetical protein
MAFDFLNRLYVFKTTQSIKDILDKLEEHIEKAPGSDKINLAVINYNQFKITGNSVIIERDPSTLTPWRGIGTVTIHLEAESNKTIGNVKIQPYSKTIIRVIFGLAFAFFGLFSMFFLWLSHSLNAVLFPFFGLILFIGGFYIGVVRTIWSLETFVETLLEDLQIESDLDSV